MRVYEYKESAIVIKDVDSLIGHLTLSHTMVGEKIRVLREKGVDFQEDLEMLLAHLILSHHGEEGGSAVRPKTPEAVALHHADNFDSQVAKEIGRMPDAGQ